MSLTVVDQGLLSSTAQYTGFKNRIINGAQVINQRGASVTTSATYVTDRWQWDSNTTSATLTFAQSSTAPAGFKNSLGITVGTADSSIAAGDLVDFRHWIEGNNVSDFGLGTASAVTFTVSFWVRSSVTGTYGASFRNSDASRVYVSTFVINAANTWEYKTITVAGDTAGTWYTDNQRGLGMNICLAGGSNYQTTANVWTAAGNYRTTSAQANFLATSGNTFYITGVQLEVGSTATSFDYRPYGTELALCQRYCFAQGAESKNFSVFTNMVGIAQSGGTQIGGPVQFPQQMRSAPTLTPSGTFRVSAYNTVFSAAANVPSIESARSTTTGAEWTLLGLSGMTAGNTYYLQDQGSGTARLVYSAEL